MTTAKRRRRRKRIVTDDLTLRSFTERDFDAFALGLEQTGVLSYCWTDLGLHRVEAQVDVDNARSIRFAERLGMVYEGTQRHGAYVIGAGGIAASTRLSLQTRYSVRGVADPEGPGYASSASLVAIAFRIGRAVTCRLRSSVKTRSSTLVRSSSGSRCHRLPRRVAM